MITNGKNNNCNRHILVTSFHNKNNIIKISKGIKQPSSVIKSIVAQPTANKNIKSIIYFKPSNILFTASSVNIDTCDYNEYNV